MPRIAIYTWVCSTLIVSLLLTACAAHRHTIWRTKPATLDSIGYATAHGRLLRAAGFSTRPDSVHSFYFRYTGEQFVLDIWSDDTIAYHGKLLAIVRSVDEPEYRYAATYRVSDSIAKRIGRAYFGLGVDSIDFERFNVLRHDVVDATGFRYEQYVGGRFSALDITYCSALDSMPAFKTIDSFNTFLRNLSAGFAAFDDLMDRVPPGTYWVWGPIIRPVFYGFRKGGIPRIRDVKVDTL